MKLDRQKSTLPSIAKTRRPAFPSDDGKQGSVSSASAGVSKFIKHSSGTLAHQSASTLLGRNSEAGDISSARGMPRRRTASSMNLESLAKE